MLGSRFGERARLRGKNCSVACDHEHCDGVSRYDSAGVQKRFSVCVGGPDASSRGFISNATPHASVDEPAHKHSGIFDERHFNPRDRSLGVVQSHPLNPAVDENLLGLVKANQDQCLFARKTHRGAPRGAVQVFA